MIETTRWVLENQIDGLKVWPEGWFGVTTSGLREGQHVMAWGRADDGTLEPAEVMYQITKPNKGGDALYALRFEED